MIDIKIKFLNENAKIPYRGSEYAAGYDLYNSLTEPVFLSSREVYKIPTGISIELPKNTFGAIFARSGLATKQGLRPANCVGVIDADYRGEIIVPLYNDSNINRLILPKERIAQLIILPFIESNFIISENLKESNREDNGFGSTDKEKR